VADANLELKISLARAGLAGDAAAAARTIKSNLDNLKVDLKIDDKSVNLAKRAIDELGNETLQTAKQAEFLRNAYNLSDSEINKVIAKMGQLERSTKEAKTQGGALQEVFTGFLRRVGESAFQAIIGAVQRLGQAVADTVRGAVAGFIEFERAIKQAGVISGSIGTEDFEALNEEVERLGIATSKTPQQIADTAVNLTRAGFSATETAGALEGVARASEATGESMEVTGDIIAKTYRTFQGSFEETGQSITESSQFIANALVQTANSTNTSISGLGESLSYIGPVAAAANQPVEDMLVLVGLLGDAGIQGSMAGTNLASALERLKIASAGGETEFSNLVRGSKRATEAFNVIGAEVRNADGSMKSVLEILPVIQQNLAGLGQADKDVLMKALFGVEGGRAFQTLLNATPERVALVTDQIKNLAQEGEGAAIRGGEQMLTGLSGALDLIGGSLGSLGNQFGEALGPGLEAIVRQATEIINTLLGMEGLFDPLTEASQRFAVALGGSQEVAGSLTDQVVNFAEVAIEQLASVIDAVTAFISTEGNVTQMATAFEDLATVLGALATVTRVVIALADGIGSLKTSAEGLPIVGDRIERFLNFPTPLNALNQTLLALGDTFIALKDFVVSAIDGILERMERILPALKPIIDNVQGVLSRLGGKPTEPAPTGDIIPAAQEPQDNRDPNRPSASTRTAAPPTPAPTPTPTEAPEPPPPPEFTALAELEDKYRNLTTTLETEQANQTRALVEGGKSREEIAAAERDFFQRRIKLNEDKLRELRAINQGALAPEDAAKVQQAILDLDRQLAGDRLKLAEDSRKAQEDAAQAGERAQRTATTRTTATVRDGARQQQGAIAQTSDAAEDAAKAEEQRIKELEEQREAYLDSIEAQMVSEQQLAAIALDSADVQLSAIDRVIDALERQGQLLEAQGNLAQAVFDLESSIGDVRREQLNELLNDEEASASEKKAAAQELLRLTQEQFAREKEALEAKQALELQQFDLEQQRAAAAEQRGIKEQELALKRLELQRLEIANEIELARLRGDDAAVQIGEAQLGLLAEQTAAQQDYLISLQQQAALSDELAKGQRGALLAGQEQQDIALANQQQGAATGLADQLREAGLGNGIDRRADRLENRADRGLQAELRQGRTAVGSLGREGINPQVAAMAATPAPYLEAALNPAQLAAPIVAELQALSGSITALAASPRQLTVQTPDPVADTSRILSDISRAQTAGVNP
jgi:TP901 family phage tail tape measure protein